MLGDGGQVSISAGQQRKKLLWAGGTVMDVVIGPEVSGGQLSVIDQWGKRGDVTPLHIHRDEAEVFYVLDGAIKAFAGESSHVVEAGGAIYLPAGQRHAFGITSDTARLITVTAPGTFAAFVRAAGVEIDGTQPAAWDFDVDRIMAAAGKHGIDIVGPPPSLD